MSEKTDFGERNKRTAPIQSKEQVDLDDPKSGLVDQMNCLPFMVIAKEYRKKAVEGAEEEAYFSQFLFYFIFK